MDQVPHIAQGACWLAGSSTEPAAQHEKIGRAIRCPPKDLSLGSFDRSVRCSFVLSCILDTVARCALQGFLHLLRFLSRRSTLSLPFLWYCVFIEKNNATEVGPPRLQTAKSRAHPHEDGCQDSESPRVVRNTTVYCCFPWIFDLLLRFVFSHRFFVRTCVLHANQATAQQDGANARVLLLGDSITEVGCGSVRRRSCCLGVPTTGMLLSPQPARCMLVVGYPSRCRRNSRPSRFRFFFSSLPPGVCFADCFPSFSLFCSRGRASTFLRLQCLSPSVCVPGALLLSCSGAARNGGGGHPLRLGLHLSMDGERTTAVVHHRFWGDRF